MQFTVAISIMIFTVKIANFSLAGILCTVLLAFCGVRKSPGPRHEQLGPQDYPRVLESEELQKKKDKVGES